MELPNHTSERIVNPGGLPNVQVERSTDLTGEVDVKRIITTVCVVLSAFLIAGCAAIMARTQFPGGDRILQDPPYFSGTAYDLSHTVEAVFAPFDGDEKTEASEFLYFSSTIFDLPFSFLLDVLYIPSDYRMNQKEGQRKNANKP
jgi:uncharacterized protein YceK